MPSILRKIISVLTGGILGSAFTGGIFDRIFDSVDKAVDNETARQQIRANAVNKYTEILAHDRADARKYMFFWYAWSLFAFPLGMWWALVVIDTFVTFIDLGIPNLPASIQPKADIIFGSIFGSGGIVVSMQGLSSAIRSRGH